MDLKFFYILIYVIIVLLLIERVILLIYVMSDIHGCYHEYIKMLELIDFNSNDTLYIIGDVLDRGENPMKILLHMMNCENIIPIFGNHDLEGYPFLIKEYNGEIDELERKFLWWISQGGRTTLEDFRSLSKENQSLVISYIEEFRYYEEVIANDTSYVLVHGGLKDFEINKPLDEYKLHDLVWERPDYNKVYFSDKFIVSGHTPTHFIDKDKRGEIIIKNNHICIDCGCVYNNRLGCLCLNTMEEFYINKENL